MIVENASGNHNVSIFYDFQALNDMHACSESDPAHLDEVTLRQEGLR